MSFAGAFHRASFAFIGITFPVTDMNTAAQVWRSLLPGKPTSEVQTAQSSYGVDAAHSLMNTSMLWYAVPAFVVILLIKKHLTQSALSAQAAPSTQAQQRNQNNKRSKTIGFTQLLKQELLAALRNPVVLLTVFGSVNLYSFLYPLPYANQVPEQLKASVVNLDKSQSSYQLERMVDATSQIDLVREIPLLKMRNKPFLTKRLVDSSSS